MKEKIKLMFLCIVMIMLICGCNNSNNNSNVNKIKEENTTEKIPDINDETHGNESKIIKNNEDIDSEINNKPEDESSDEMIINGEQIVIENNDDNLLGITKSDD